MKKIIAIDAGNTALKIGEFQESELKAVKRMALSELLRQLKPAIADSNLSIVVSSVLKSEDLELLTEIIPTAIILNPTCILPFNNQYATPSTLGMDRLCNAGYAYKFMGTDYAVVIDLGTCLKFDLVHYQQGYLGGSISPGIDLRYRSLNEHTGNLPLISNKSKTNLVGNNTEESIRSGVMNGIHAEISSIMKQYSLKYKNLTFFMTGGDISNFEIEAKNDIFADENLTLKGLYEIYKANV